MHTEQVQAVIAKINGIKTPAGLTGPQTEDVLADLVGFTEGYGPGNETFHDDIQGVINQLFAIQGRAARSPSEQAQSLVEAIDRMKSGHGLTSTQTDEIRGMAVAIKGACASEPQPWPGQPGQTVPPTDVATQQLRYQGQRPGNYPGSHAGNPANWTQSAEDPIARQRALNQSNPNYPGGPNANDPLYPGQVNPAAAPTNPTEWQARQAEQDRIEAARLGAGNVPQTPR